MSERSVPQNLLATSAAGPEATRLPADPAAAEVDESTDLVFWAAAHPASSLGWALLAETALHDNTSSGDVRAYAYARTGYHRGLDALRRAGWRGSGPVPWEHEPNQGFLRALWALSVAADRIGEESEAERCAQFLRDCSETAYSQLAGHRGSTSEG